MKWVTAAADVSATSAHLCFPASIAGDSSGATHTAWLGQNPIFCTSFCLTQQEHRNTRVLSHLGLSLTGVGWNQHISALAALPSDGQRQESPARFSGATPHPTYTHRTCPTAHSSSLSRTHSNRRPVFVRYLNFQGHLPNEQHAPTPSAWPVLCRRCCGGQRPSLRRSTDNCRGGTWSSVDLLQSPQQVMMSLGGAWSHTRKTQHSPKSSLGDFRYVMGKAGDVTTRTIRRWSK